MTAVVFLLGAYLLGSIPFGLVIVWAVTGRDIRQGGSGNIGATNARRAAGNIAGAMTLVADMAKGAVPVALAMSTPTASNLLGGVFVPVVALAAFIGHLYPIFLKFKGGKGVATAAGGLAPVAPGVILVALAAFIAVVAWGRRVSLGSLTAAVMLPLGGIFFQLPLALTGIMAVMALFIVLRHRENIRRLLNGTEPKLGG